MEKEFSVNKNGLSDQCVTDGMEKCTLHPRIALAQVGRRCMRTILLNAQSMENKREKREKIMAFECFFFFDLKF